MPAGSNEVLLVPSASHPAVSSFQHELRKQSTARERRQMYKRTAVPIPSQYAASHSDPAQDSVEPRPNSSTATPRRLSPAPTWQRPTDSSTARVRTAPSASASDSSDTLRAPAVDSARRIYPRRQGGPTPAGVGTGNPPRRHGIRALASTAAQGASTSPAPPSGQVNCRLATAPSTRTANPAVVPRQPPRIRGPAHDL